MLKKLAILSLVSLYCHFLHFFIVQFKCEFPDLDPHTKNQDESTISDAFYVSKDESEGLVYNPDELQNLNDNLQHFMLFSDPHLLGPNVNFFDKLWHEHHMKISYESARWNQRKTFHEVMILGDIFDWGMFLKHGQEFDDQVNHFHEIFPNAHALLGNHDVAFPVHTNTYRISRMNAAMGRRSLAEVLTVSNQNFVVLNSVGASGDGSDISKEFDRKLDSINRILFEDGLKSEKVRASIINGTLNQTPNNPILVQHFPLWRHDDSICSTKPSDTANAHDRFYVNKPAREAVPAAISKNILEKIKPRIIFSGHTHNWCLREFDRNSVGNGKKMGLKHPLFELSVPSFSWRNRNNPSYLMVSVSDHGIGWQKCFVPRQSTIVGIYVVTLLILFFVKL